MDNKYYSSITKIKWSISNFKQSQFHDFETANNQKYDEWRKYKVGDSLPPSIWMNDDDIFIFPCFLKRSILVISPHNEARNEGITGRITTPRQSPFFPRSKEKGNALFTTFPAIIDDDFNIHYYEKTNQSLSSKINLHPNDFLQKSQGCIIKNIYSHF